MVRKSAHPDSQLFDYLSGRLDAGARRAVEDHLSGCPDCARVAAIVRAIKEQPSRPSSLRHDGASDHPDVSALARFFYSRSSRAANRATAAHVATCASCAGELAEYARAERAASEHDLSRARPVEIPKAALEMIRDWEESDFAKPKPPQATLDRDMLVKLSTLLYERKRQITEMTARAADEAARPDLVPVIIVDRSGKLHGVEMFEQTVEPTGASTLKHAENSDRFADKPVHALLDFGEQGLTVLSDVIRRDTVRLKPVTRADRELRRADYFIIED